jgi:tetratricopeptide (TPR) repeat protein
MKFRLLTAVWGAEFCDHFIRIAARSLLAPGNFPDLSRRHPTGYTILTTERDARRIQASPVFAALAACGPVDFLMIGEDEIDPVNPSSHWTMWGKGIEAAKKNGEFVIYVMPDIAYASGTMLDWAQSFEHGYRAIFSPIPEVVLETTLRELEETFPAERQLPLSLSVPEATRLLVKHLHPYHLCMLRNSRRWVWHPESVGYVIPGAAFVQRVVGSHPICFDPNFFQFNHAYVPQNHFDKIAILPCTAISLEPFLKFMYLYYRPWSMAGDRLSNCGWWFDFFTGPANAVESLRSYVFPLSDTWPVAAVARAHASGSFYRTQCLAAGGIFRVWNKLVALGCTRAAEVLATAHYAGRMRRHKLFAGHTTVLAPSNEACERAGLNLAGGGEKDRRRKLLDLAYAHCFAGHHRFEPGQSIAATTGGEIRAAARADDPTAAGSVVSGPHELGGFTVYVTDFVVGPRDAAANGGPRPEREARRLRRAHPSSADPYLIVVHSSFVGSTESGEFDPELRRQPTDTESDQHDAAFLNILRERVKNAFAPPAALDLGAAEQETAAPARAAQECRAHAGSSALHGLRGRLRRAGSELGAWLRAGRSPSEGIRQKQIRELLLANRFEEADAVSVGSAQSWRELGGEFAAHGQLEPALYCRRRAAELSPDDLQMRMEWVRDLLFAGRLDDARVAGRGLVQLWRALSGGLLWEGHRDLGLHCLHQAVEAAPADLGLRQELVRELLLAGRLDEARSAGRGLTQLWRNVGGEFHLRGQRELELFCRRRAVESDPAGLQVRQELLRELLLAGRFEEASAADAGLLRPWHVLGHGFVSEGKRDLALHCWRRAVELDPSDSQSRKDLVRALLLADSVKEANEASAGFRPLWRELAAEFGSQGHLELKRYCLAQVAGSASAASESPAEGAFRKLQVEIGLVALHDLLKSYAGEIGSSSHPAWSNGYPGPLECFDQFLAANGRPLDPLKGLTQLLQQHPDFAEAWVEKAFLHLEAGQNVLAVDAALQAFRARPGCLRAGHNPHPRGEAAALVGSCLERVGLPEQAIAAYRACLAIDQGQLLVDVRLGHLLWRQGSVGEAMQEFMKGMPFGCQLANFPDVPRRVEMLSLD